jgi:lipoprotein-anchoring transpeptidase ErfK/SrfK
MSRTAVVALALAALSLSQQPAAPDFGQRFRTAAQEPGQIVPLILDVSATIPKVDGATGQQLADSLEPYLRQVFFAPSSIPGIERLGVVKHEVKSGELPGAIAKRARIGAGMLKYLNAQYDERRINAGAKLNLLELSNGSLQLIVDIHRYRLAAWHQTPEGQFVLNMYVAVGVGAPESPTPSGTTKIIDRVRNPAWTEPKTKQVFPHGDPGNVLGGYWIKLDPEGLGGVTGIGLHGYTGAPSIDWLSKGSSSGCVRMLQPDIDRVFELALEGTKVVLVR